jgi:hypothetical protein
MNTLLANSIENQDFSPIRNPRSGLITHILNTLRKIAGEGESSKTSKDH